MTVEILMATYNGEKYLEEQLRSLLSQTFSDFTLIVNDDHSKDGTIEILKKFQNEFEHMTISEVKCGGASENFAFLLAQSKADYVFFADQDDIWFPDKVERLLERIQDAERRWGKNTPLVLHTDTSLVDQRGKMFAPSMWAYQYTRPDWPDRFERILTQNVAAGCTMVANRAQVNKVLPMPAMPLPHDWWMVLVASAFGRVVPVYEQTLLYRQHGANTQGAVKFNFQLVVQKVLREQNLMLERKIWICAQAEQFANRYPGTESAEIARTFSQLRKMPYAQRVYTMFKYGFYKVGVVRNLGWIFL